MARKQMQNVIMLFLFGFLLMVSNLFYRQWVGFEICMLVGWILILIGAVLVVKNSKEKRMAKWLCVIAGYCIVCLMAFLIYNYNMMYVVDENPYDSSYTFFQLVGRIYNGSVIPNKYGLNVNLILFIQISVYVLPMVGFLLLYLILDEWVELTGDEKLQKNFRRFYLISVLPYMICGNFVIIGLFRVVFVLLLMWVRKCVGTS